MDDRVRTNPTATVTAQEFADVASPPAFAGLSDEDKTAALTDVEQRALELARRLGVDRTDGRLPAYIWAIVFGQSRT